MIEKEIDKQINRKELFDYINAYGTSTAMEEITCRCCPLSHDNGGECNGSTQEDCQRRFNEFYKEEKERNKRPAANKEIEIKEPISEEDLFNYIDVFGSEKIAIKLSCFDCPLSNLKEGDCEHTSVFHCQQKLRDFYAGWEEGTNLSKAKETKISVVFEEEESNQVEIRSLSVGTFFIYHAHLYEVIKNTDGEMVKAKDWNTSEVAGFSDIAKAEVVDIEIRVKKRKED